MINISGYLWSNPGEIDINMLEEFSNTFYPSLYCDCVEATKKACYEENILELWGDQVNISVITEISFHKYWNIAKFPFAPVIFNRGYTVATLSLIHLSWREHLQGSYSATTEERIGRLTEQEIIDVINAKNTSQIFMKDFDFKDLLGNIRYNQSGHIVGQKHWFKYVPCEPWPWLSSGAGVVEMRFFTTVNVTDVKLRGTATRGEKIDIQSYKFEGETVRR